MSKSLRHVLNYNENKVKEKQATCIGAEGFGLEPDELTFSAKKFRFEQLTRKNRGAGTNIAHVTLSFAPEEQLSKVKLLEIAAAYMQKTGFGDQPYLVYQHHDTNNTHVHIVSTNIRSNGTRIETHMIGATLSAAARLQIEEEFGLVKATGRGDKHIQGIVPLDLKKYLADGQKGKATISAIVRNVISKYKFSSLPEFNAVLRQFNVIADPGQPGSLLHQRGGLLYSAIDEEDNKMGAQIKSSSIYVHGWGKLLNNAGLKLLKAKFKSDRYKKREYRARLTAKVEALLSRGVTLSEFRTGLQKDQIALSIRFNVQGRISGITFIDNEHAVVFKGSDLKKSLGAAAIQARLLTCDKIQRTLHRAMVKDALNRTDFKAGFRSVLEQWQRMGILVIAIQLPGGETVFFMGAAHLPAGSHPPVPLKINRYLRANLAREERRERRHLEAATAARQAAFYQELAAYHQAGLLHYSIIDELLHAEDPHEGLPIALLREARKKRRRKRSR